MEVKVAGVIAPGDTALAEFTFKEGFAVSESFLQAVKLMLITAIAIRDLIRVFFMVLIYLFSRQRFRV
jgi:hypothetical protein